MARRFGISKRSANICCPTTLAIRDAMTTQVNRAIFSTGDRLRYLGCVPTKLLVPTEGIPSNRTVEELVSAYREQPETVPPIILESYGEEEYDVQDGHHRLAAAKRVGAPCVPAILHIFEDEVDIGERFPG